MATPTPKPTPAAAPKPKPTPTTATVYGAPVPPKAAPAPAPTPAVTPKPVSQTPAVQGAPRVPVGAPAAAISNAAAAANSKANTYDVGKADAKATVDKLQSTFKQTVAPQVDSILKQVSSAPTPETPEQKKKRLLQDGSVMSMARTMTPAQQNAQWGMVLYDQPSATPVPAPPPSPMATPSPQVQQSTLPASMPVQATGDIGKIQEYTSSHVAPMTDAENKQALINAVNARMEENAQNMGSPVIPPSSTTQRNEAIQDVMRNLQTAQGRTAVAPSSQMPQAALLGEAAKPTPQESIVLPPPSFTDFVKAASQPTSAKSTQEKQQGVISPVAQEQVTKQNSATPKTAKEAVKQVEKAKQNVVKKGITTSPIDLRPVEKKVQGTKTMAKLADGTPVDAYIRDGVAYLETGERIPKGTTVRAGGKDWVLGEDGVSREVTQQPQQQPQQPQGQNEVVPVAPITTGSNSGAGAGAGQGFLNGAPFYSSNDSQGQGGTSNVMSPPAPKEITQQDFAAIAAKQVDEDIARKTANLDLQIKQAQENNDLEREQQLKAYKQAVMDAQNQAFLADRGITQGMATRGLLNSGMYSDALLRSGMASQQQIGKLYNEREAALNQNQAAFRQLMDKVNQERQDLATGRATNIEKTKQQLMQDQLALDKFKQDQSNREWDAFQSAVVASAQANGQDITKILPYIANRDATGLSNYMTANNLPMTAEMTRKIKESVANTDAKLADTNGVEYANGQPILDSKGRKVKTWSRILQEQDATIRQKDLELRQQQEKDDYVIKQQQLKIDQQNANTSSINAANRGTSTTVSPQNMQRELNLAQDAVANLFVDDVQPTYGVTGNITGYQKVGKKIPKESYSSFSNILQSYVNNGQISPSTAKGVFESYGVPVADWLRSSAYERDDYAIKNEKW